MSRFKKIFKNTRVLIALVILILALVALHPNPLAKGVTIRAVSVNSSAALAGIPSPKPTTPPMSRERIIAMNGIPIKTLEDYYDFIERLKVNRTVLIKTNKNIYKLVTKPKYETIQLNETEKKEIGLDIGLTVYQTPKTNIRMGLDLQGGTRVLLQPETEISDNEMEMLIENMKYRLNIYGLSDVIVRKASDMSGNQYVLVEIAGAKEEEVKGLLAKQGKFEATIGNETVFKGGKDITYVCRSADCAGIDPTQGCGQSDENQWICRFRFAISLSPEAANRQAELTKDLEVISESSEEYLSEKLVLFLDNAKVDELNIAADLKGRATTDIAISGSGIGSTRQEAVFNALENMKRLQTILITGSLPVKLDVVKTDAISPIFGEEFIKNSILIGLLALLAVAIVIFARYRKISVVVPMTITVLAEVLIILGVAALIGWNIDLAAIAGIVIAIGTGVDHQIIITDETLSGESAEIYDWKKRIKRAFFIIMGAFFTTVVAMMLLYIAGAGLLRGFAVTTIMGALIGVFITRPAYASIIEILLKK